MVPLDLPEFQRWREQAGGALASSEMLSGAEHFDWACFLSEQAGQLAVKGLLHGTGQEAWGHDITVLVSRARDLFARTARRDVTAAAARLSRHYIPAHYPDAHPSGTPADHFTAVDADGALADARLVLGAVDAAWAALATDSDS